jgi:hypothetical protein
MKNFKLPRKNNQLIRISVALIILKTFACSGLIAQVPLANESILAANAKSISPLHSIKDFSARTVDNIVYVNLVMKGETENTVLLLEKSTDGEEFNAIAQKDGYPAPDGTTDILYCFTDSHPAYGRSFYRVKQFRKDGILYSHVATIINNKNIQLVGEADE